MVEVMFEYPSNSTKNRRTAIFFLINPHVVINSKNAEVVIGNANARKVIGQKKTGLIKAVQQLNR
jgi:hypothetical protein